MERNNNVMVGAFGAEMTVSVKGLIADAIGDATGNNMEMISSVIREGKTEELDRIVGKIENQYLDYTTKYNDLHSSCYVPERAELNIFIRHVLNEQVGRYEKYEKPLMHGEKYRQIEDAEYNMKILKEIVAKYEGTSTDWQDQAFKYIKESGNKTLLMVAGWLFV